MRKGRLAGAFALVLTAACVYLAHPTEATLAIAVVAAIPFLWLAVDERDPPRGSPPGPWSGP